MNTPPTETERLLQLASEVGAFRLRDAHARGIHPEVVYRLVRSGALERVGRDLYRATSAMVTENHDLVLAANAVSGGGICLLSALRFHELTTQLPFEVWVAIDRRAARPRRPAVAVRIMRFSGSPLTANVEEHLLEGVPVHIYSPGKTVVDCFRYRNLVGLDVAVEALRDCLEQRKCAPAELWEIARECRISTVMRPYIEAMG